MDLPVSPTICGVAMMPQRGRSRHRAVVTAIWAGGVRVMRYKKGSWDPQYDMSVL